MMATTANTGNLILMQAPSAASPVTSVAAAVSRRRRISLDAGKALEMLGHAIEYLADEYALECLARGERGVSQKNAQVIAIELLMARNREIYFSCPEVPSLGERLRGWLHLQRA